MQNRTVNTCATMISITANSIVLVRKSSPSVIGAGKL